MFVDKTAPNIQLEGGKEEQDRSLKEVHVYKIDKDNLEIAALLESSNNGNEIVFSASGIMLDSSGDGEKLLAKTNEKFPFCLLQIIIISDRLQTGQTRVRMTFLKSLEMNNGVLQQKSVRAAIVKLEPGRSWKRKGTKNSK